jgi:hypothetical protein
LTFKRSGSGYRISPGRQSTRAWRTVHEEPESPSVLHVLHGFLCFFRSIHFVGGFLLHEVGERSVLECQTVCGGADGPRAHRGRSVIEGAVLEVLEHFSDSPPYENPTKTSETPLSSSKTHHGFTNKDLWSRPC